MQLFFLYTVKVIITELFGQVFVCYIPRKKWKYSEIKLLFDIWKPFGCDKCLKKKMTLAAYCFIERGFNLFCVGDPCYGVSALQKGLKWLCVLFVQTCSSVFACLIRQETLKPMVYLWFKRCCTILQPILSNLIPLFN